ncbi:MAG: hypothetical protein IPG71_14020 [bacterium]|nr:hypothetical protein [bacterium]
MNKKLQRILLALGLSVVVAFAVGCSEDDEEDPPAGPTYAERLVGQWWAIDSGTQLGSDSAEFTFRADGSFHYIEYFTLLDAYITKDGDYSATEGGDITFELTLDDSVAVDSSFTWGSEFHSTSDDTLHIDYYFGEGTPTTVTFINVTPPAN